MRSFRSSHCRGYLRCSLLFRRCHRNLIPMLISTLLFIKLDCHPSNIQQPTGTLSDELQHRPTLGSRTRSYPLSDVTMQKKKFRSNVVFCSFSSTDDRMTILLKILIQSSLFFDTYSDHREKNDSHSLSLVSPWYNLFK
jgi:hypothetical protein